MNSSEVLTYLLSHAPLERFYLFAQAGDGSALMMYFDSRGRPWSIMEDDDETVSLAVDFLKRSGAPVFDDYPALRQYEQEAAKRFGSSVNGQEG